MKSPKKPSKESSLPSQDESRRTNVLFEKLISEFRTFGEAQSIMREHLDRMEPDLHAVKEDVAILKSVARSHTDAIRTNTEDIRSLKEVVQGHTKAIQDNTEATRANAEDIRSLKEVVQGHTKVIQDNTEAIHAMQADLGNINQRVEVVEAKLAS